MAKKARRNRSVLRRVGEEAVRTEPGMYGVHLPPAGTKISEIKVPVTGDDLIEYRDVAAAFPEGTRNPDNSWEVHQMLKDHADRYELIKRPWTEASLAQHLNYELIAKASLPQGHRNASPSEIDKYMAEYSAHGFDPETMRLVHSPEGGDPMLFPAVVLEKARAAGEHLVEFTKEEMEAWRESEGDKAKVRFVLNFEQDTATSTTRLDLDRAWQRNNEEVQRAKEQIGALNQKVALAATNLLAATEGATSPGWTEEEIKTHLGTAEDRVGVIIQDMLDAGHLEVHTRADGVKAYRLNQAGREFVTKPMHDDDPRFMSKQWFHDANVALAHKR